MPIVRRLGPARSLQVAYAAIAVGLVLLPLAGTQWVAAVFAVVAGFGIGASSPLVGMYSRDVFGEKSLGTAMGSMSMVFLVVGALGPALAGWVATETGSRALPVLGAAVVTVAAIPLVHGQTTSK
jgi:MFS family permease